MADFDLIIRNGILIDGTGGPAISADLGIKDGKIAAIGAIGAIDATASEEINADGQTVAPGFIDIHTHFDPQLCWDGYATPLYRTRHHHGCHRQLLANPGTYQRQWRRSTDRYVWRN